MAHWEGPWHDDAWAGIPWQPDAESWKSLYRSEDSWYAGRESRRKTFRPYHAINVPRQADLENTFSTVGKPPVTTLMFRNIPNKYSQAGLLKEMDAHGFKGKYDFFYMPMDVQNRTNVGYAFINFVTEEDAQLFLTAFANYRFKSFPSSKIGTVSPGHVQGLMSNVLHFANRAVTQSRNAQYRPLVFRNGKQIDIKVACQEFRALLELQESASRVEHTDSSWQASLNPSAAEFVPQQLEAFHRGAEEKEYCDKALDEAGRLAFLGEVPRRWHDLTLTDATPSAATSSRSRSSSISGGSTASPATASQSLAFGKKEAEQMAFQMSWQPQADHGERSSFGHLSRIFPGAVFPTTS